MILIVKKFGDPFALNSPITLKRVFHPISKPLEVGSNNTNNNTFFNEGDITKLK